MKSFKQILETVYRPKGGDEQAFLDKHVVDLQAHPVANEFQFKAAKTPKAKRKADYDEKEDEKVYEAAEVHTKRADKEPVIVRSTDPKTGESKAKTVMRRAGEIKIGEEVELDEAFKKGDIVKPTKGPHKGHPHEVIHDFGDGNYNIKPKGLNPKQIRYSMGAAKAHKSDLVKEEVELEESITKMSDARLKFHATKNVPHGSYTRKEVEDEHKRRVKTGGVSYASVKPSLNEEADLDEKVKNPYAVGMAAAMKATGDTPPLKKSTIVKGHEIAKSIKKEAMDPVGKADADIDNDGDVDKSDKYLHARRKAIGKALRKEEVELDEAKLSASQRDRLDDLILSVHTTTHPEYDGGELPQKYLKAIEKEFGAKIAKQVDDGSYQMHFGRDNQAHGHDKLASRQWSSKFKGGPRVTAAGKMNKQDVNALKTRIKNDKKFGGLLKSVKLPEEVELDEGTYVGGPAHTSPQWIGGINSKKSKAIRSHLTKMGHDFKDHGDGENNVKNNTHHISMKTKEGHAELQKIKSQHGLSQHPYGTPGHTRLQDHKGKADKADLPNHVNHDSKASYMKEEVEQIDELSSDTLKSYLKNAKSNYRKHKTKTNDWDSRTDSRSGKIMDYPWKGGEAPSKDTEDKTRKAVSKRSIGLLTARGKLGMKNYGLPVKVKANEEVEQIDELKKSTLGSYVKKASSDMASNAYNLGARDPLKKPGSWDKAFKRKAGIERASDRLAKEEVELDEAFKIGAMKLKDGSSVTLTRESVDALNGLFNQLNSANKSKMEERMMSGQKGFKEILSFAENI